MLLLDLCWFARKQFRIGQYAVRKHSGEEIRQLGPGYDVMEAFYRRERLDPEWFSQQWFLKKSHTRFKKPATFTLEFPRDVSAGRSLATSSNSLPALACVFSGAHCRRQPARLRACAPQVSHPQVDYVGEGPDEVPYRLYKVEEREWSAFRKFCGEWKLA
jgi:hypothetical protein